MEVKVKLYVTITALLLPSQLIAQEVCQTHGTSTYCYGNDGYSSSQREFGNKTYGHDNKGNNWLIERHGNKTYTYPLYPTFRQ
jgi:hypothetical protein